MRRCFLFATSLGVATAAIQCSLATDACTCATLSPDCGWSRNTETCEAGKDTDCQECPGQDICDGDQLKVLVSPDGAPPSFFCRHTSSRR
jgi:hypothetical protein